MSKEHPLDIFCKESKLTSPKLSDYMGENHIGINEYIFKAEIYMWGANKGEVYSDVWRDLKRAFAAALEYEKEQEKK